MATKVNTSPRLKSLYLDKLRAEVGKELGITNVMRIPKVEKISINVGLGRSQDDKRAFEVAATTLAKITGQQPVKTISRMSIASFKLREGSAIGMKVTLRGDRMYEFLDRLIAVVLPRMRDFHGVSLKSFDKNGNYSLGFTEQSVFPELSFEDTTFLHGLQVTISTTAKDPTEGLALLKAMGMPFQKGKE